MVQSIMSSVNGLIENREVLNEKETRNRVKIKGGHS